MFKNPLSHYFHVIVKILLNLILYKIGAANADWHSLVSASCVVWGGVCPVLQLDALPTTTLPINLGLRLTQGICFMHALPWLCSAANIISNYEFKFANISTLNEMATYLLKEFSFERK